MAKHISIFAFILLSIRPAVARSGTATFCTLPEKVCSCTSTLFKGDSVINPADTMMLWDVDTIDYGSLKVGETLSVQYGFLNISKENLEIEAGSACNCMQIEWTPGAILPGQRGVVEIWYDSKEDFGPQQKNIDVILKNIDAKGYPLVRRAILKGIIEKP